MDSPPVSSRDEPQEDSESEGLDECVSLSDTLDDTDGAFTKYIRRFREIFKPHRRAKKLSEMQPVHHKEDGDEYDFTYPERGMAVIINNKTFGPESRMRDRKGSDLDASNLKNMFQRLGFKVLRCDNLTKDEMVRTLLKVASNKQYDHTKADCFACAILSHGAYQELEEPPSAVKSRQDIIYGVDGRSVTTRHLVSIFNDECCPELEGKPRLFFIQACRGTRTDAGAYLTVMETGAQPTTQSVRSDKGASDAVPNSYNQPGQKDMSHDKKPKLDEEEVDRGQSGYPAQAPVFSISPCPIYKDFLLMYAIPPGFFAWRNKDTGAWMMQCLASVLQEKDIHDTPLTTLLTRVSHLMTQFESQTDNPEDDKKKAVPCVMSMLTKAVYFRDKAVPH